MNKAKKGNFLCGKYVPLEILLDPKQFWLGVLLISMFLILFCEINWKINSSPYLEFLTFLGTVYLGGSHLNAFFNNNKSSTVNDNTEIISNQPINKNQVYLNPRREPKDFQIDLNELYT